MSYHCFSQAFRNTNCFRHRFVLSFTILPFLLSFITLTVISLERYMGILYPIKHRYMVTKRKIKLFLVGRWLFMLIAMVALLSLQSEMFHVFLSICMALFLLLVIFVYTRIFFVIQKRNTPGNVGDISASNSQNKRTFLKTLQQAKSCFLAVGCFVVCLAAGICLLSSWFNVDKIHIVGLRAWAGAVI